MIGAEGLFPPSQRLLIVWLRAGVLALCMIDQAQIILRRRHSPVARLKLFGLMACQEKQALRVLILGLISRRGSRFRQCLPTIRRARLCKQGDRSQKKNHKNHQAHWYHPLRMCCAFIRMSPPSLRLPA
jgi:hypothetical protein